MIRRGLRAGARNRQRGPVRGREGAGRVCGAVAGRGGIGVGPPARDADVRLFFPVRNLHLVRRGRRWGDGNRGGEPGPLKAPR